MALIRKLIIKKLGNWWPRVVRNRRIKVLEISREAGLFYGSIWISSYTFGTVNRVGKSVPRNFEIAKRNESMSCHISCYHRSSGFEDTYLIVHLSHKLVFNVRNFKKHFRGIQFHHNKKSKTLKKRRLRNLYRNCFPISKN